MKTKPTPEARAALAKFADDVYLHQVLARNENGKIKFYRDLSDALADNSKFKFKIQNFQSGGFIFMFRSTRPPRRRLKILMIICSASWICWRRIQNFVCISKWKLTRGKCCQPELKSRSVVEQLAAEYDWTLARLAERGTRQPVNFLGLLCAMDQNFIRQLRTLLVLGRVSNLPTVWSNCLAVGG
ncbi:MAG: hypothetical protein WDM76_09000 [Limisphaerales bacterium]